MLMVVALAISGCGLIANPWLASSSSALEGRAAVGPAQRMQMFGALCSSPAECASTPVLVSLDATLTRAIARRSDGRLSQAQANQAAALVEQSRAALATGRIEHARALAAQARAITEVSQ
jgi:hypothetical protein